jgi:hypothetical protein
MAPKPGATREATDKLICSSKLELLSQAWWRMPAIAVLKRLRWEDYKFKASLGYTVRPCLKNQ